MMWPLGRTGRGARRMAEKLRALWHRPLLLASDDSSWISDTEIVVVGGRSPPRAERRSADEYTTRRMQELAGEVGRVVGGQEQRR